MIVSTGVQFVVNVFRTRRIGGITRLFTVRRVVKAAEINEIYASIRRKNTRTTANKTENYRYKHSRDRIIVEICNKVLKNLICFSCYTMHVIVICY